ncbi:asparagine synthetase B [Hydrogenophaga crassostreae]|uniref:asparagine synthase (glutamine-hydrolyzing) n=1 Tax=Hydrogenophaga crassostreae TaxID=1763535 RepID=A0A167H926_9BURK|nr:asparagine synthase (glutamine-hydrolyzing) [Hydrogenophaga crassostreae]AOW12646.1 asparagine synthase (glutamine-hydrolyzing) [Hydrogenophaga crassostreae]OAD40518.1 asparagine synthetase B [Hydrogenophaga crassostreae]
MCGVFAFISKAPVKDAATVLHTGIEKLRHRGPDGEGKWIAEDHCIGLAHVRLSVIDLSTHASQPMKDPASGLVITFNGEIYNHIELRREIGGHFHSESDTEVILRAYLKWGEACVNKLRGMFAFIIWDPIRNKSFVARDRFGIKPLYFTTQGGVTYFASEIKALVPFMIQRTISSAALSEYFAFQFTISGSALMEGVHEVPAAHCGMVSAESNIVFHRYWEVHYEPDAYHTEQYFVERLHELMAESVEMHMRADVEVGAYVSGGVDSSLLAILARESRPTGQFKIFNGRFTEGPEYDESRYASDVANQNGLSCFIQDINERDFVDNFRKIIYHLDEPIAGPGSFPQFMVSRLAASKLKVVLGGQGGDEIFGGYARYLVAYFEQCIKGALEGTSHNGQFIVTYESIIPNLITLKEYQPLLKEFWSSGLFGPRDERYFRLINRSNTLGGVITPDAISFDSAFEAFQKIFWVDNVGPEAYFDRMTHFDFKTLLPALLQVEDRMSMAHGLESRVPFLDHPVVDFAATIPPNIKFANGELKRLLRLAFGSKLPESVRDRRDKMGFPVPLNKWLKSGGLAYQFVQDTLGSSRARNRAYLEPKLDLASLIDTQGGFSRNLWGLLSLELWQQEFVD